MEPGVDLCIQNSGGAYAKRDVEEAERISLFLQSYVVVRRVLDGSGTNAEYSLDHHDKKGLEDHY